MKAWNDGKQLEWLSNRAYPRCRQVPQPFCDHQLLRCRVHYRKSLEEGGGLVMIGFCSSKFQPARVQARHRPNRKRTKNGSLTSSNHQRIHRKVIGLGKGVDDAVVVRKRFLQVLRWASCGRTTSCQDLGPGCQSGVILRDKQAKDAVKCNRPIELL